MVFSQLFVIVLLADIVINCFYPSLELIVAGPDLAGGRPGAQSSYRSISVTTVFP